jgi:uncharacterized protein (DUF433 family)
MRSETPCWRRSSDSGQVFSHGRTPLSNERQTGKLNRMTNPAEQTWVYLERDRFSSYRQLSIKGRRIRAWTLFTASLDEETPRTLEEIAADYDVPVGAVREAIAYCESKPVDIELDFLYEEMLAEATGATDPKNRGRSRTLSIQERIELDRAYAVREKEILERAAMTPTKTPTTWAHLAPNPKSSYKQLFIKGTRIRARVLYGLYMSEEAPQTPEEIAADYGLSVEAVKEAIAYCQSNPPEIEQDFRRDEARMEATGMNDPTYKYHPSPRLLTAQEIARLEEL